MNYFAIERNGQCNEHIMLTNDNGSFAFKDYLAKDYDTMKNSADLEDFVCAVMDATEDFDGDQVAITLVGEDGVFIWGIIIGRDEEDSLRYVLIDWKKDGTNYRYES